MCGSNWEQWRVADSARQIYIQAGLTLPPEQAQTLAGCMTRDQLKAVQLEAGAKRFRAERSDLVAKI